MKAIDIAYAPPEVRNMMDAMVHAGPPPLPLDDLALRLRTMPYGDFMVFVESLAEPGQNAQALAAKIWAFAQRGEAVL